MNSKEKGIILFSLLMLSQLFLLGSIILKPTEANGQLGQTEDNNNNLYNHDQFGINDIILPKSSSLPSFTWNTITDNKISSYELTTLAVYDFLPNANCPDILIGTANDGFYLFVGQQYPFTSFAWATSFALNTSVASPIKALYPMHIGGIHQTTTEIYVGNGQGNQFYFRHNNYARSRYSQLTYWENTSKEDQSAGYIYGHSITSSIQVELGGSYDINDEIVVGLDNGNLVQVVTESVDYGTVASKYSEYLVSNAFSNSVDDIVAGDVDLDGDIDLVTSFSGGSTYTFGNDGTPRVGTWGSQLTTSTPGVLALGDLDIDGYPDLVLGSSTGYIYVYRNTGNMLSSSLTAVTKASLSVGVNDIAAADLDNDGDLDIVAALNNGTIILLENPEHVPVGDTRVDPFQTGSSGYWNQEVLTDQTGAVNKIKIVDMDNDGDLDIVAIYSDGWARIYQNNLAHVSTSKFRFGPAETIETNTINNLEDNKIAIGDLDNDGFDDLVVGSLSSSTDTNATIKIFKNPGYDTFVNFDLVNTWNSYVIYSWRNAKIYGIDIKDIDHDGDNDILFIENKTCVRALKNDGTPWQTYWQGNIPTTLLDATANSLTGNTILLVDDLDYDWKNEIFWLSTEIGTNQGNITAFRQQSDPWLSWNDRVNISGNPFNNDPVVGAVIDYFDNDNFRDLIYYDNSHIVAKQGTSNINAMYNLNSYTSLYNASSNTIISLTNIEYSGDKSADLIFSLTTNDLALKGLRNQPSNTPGFNNPWNEDYRAPSDYQIIGSATGDLNNDGKSDAIIWNSTSFWACQGNNDINFNWTKYFIDTISEGIRDLKIKDIDHDGDLDIIISTKDHVYYYPNRFRDDVNPPDLTININPLYSADTVVINASSNESLYSSPWIKIFDGVTTTYAQMTPTGAPLTWTYTYHVVR
ncbi:MAG: FG-GAP repeat domain-containing protein, partial [Promethearchaeota archaeon]